MTWIEKIVSKRAAVIAFAGVITVAAALFSTRVQVNTDILSFLPHSSPHVQLFEKTGRVFGGSYLAIVGVEADDVFTFPVLQAVDKLTNAFAEIDGVSSVTSLTNVIDFRETDWGVEVTKLIREGRIPSSASELERLRRYTLSRSLYRGKLVSSDGKVTLILARLRPESDRVAVAKQIRDITRRVVGDSYRTYYAGIPFQMEFLGRLILSDMWRLTPVAALLILLILYLSFRSVRGMVLPFMTVAISAVWTFGLMGICGIPLSLISAATPVLILAVGSAYGIHLMKKYSEVSSTCSSPRQAVVQTVREVGVPIMLAAVTTFAGFLSLQSSELSIVRDFGLATGMGILFALAVALTLVPCLLSYLSLRPARTSLRRPAVPVPSSFVRRQAQSLGKHPGRWTAAFAAVTFASILGIPRITREVNLSEYFKPSSEIRVSENLMEERFGGSYPAQIVVRGDVKHPAILSLMRRIERELEAYPWLTNAQSVADLICEMNRVMNDRYVVPETREGVGNLWFLLEGQDIMEQLVTGDLQQAQIQLRIRSLDTGIIIRSVDYIDQTLRSLPDTFVCADLTDAALPVAGPVDSFRVRMALQNLDCEFRRRGLEYRGIGARLQQLLWDYLRAARSPAVSPDLALRMAEEAARFLTSDESEIYLDDLRVVKRFTRELQAALQTGLIRGTAEVAALLRRCVPQSREVDTETLHDTAAQLRFLMLETRKQWQTDSLVSELVSLLPSKTPTDPDLPRDLKAAVWVLNRTRLFVPAPLYREWNRRFSLPAADTVSVELEQAGMGPIFKELDAKLLRSQLTSLGLALAVVFLLLCLQLRSAKLGLVGTTPLLLTLAVNFGLMGFLHVPLDDATLMIAPLAIGIGVDYAIHFTYRFRRELQILGQATEALERTLKTTGLAILINAVSVGLGFCVLLLGDVVPVQRFGLLVALAMFVSAIGALTLLPAALMLTKRLVTSSDHDR